jgi:hypothetical protein
MAAAPLAARLATPRTARALGPEATHLRTVVRGWQARVCQPWPVKAEIATPAQAVTLATAERRMRLVRLVRLGKVSRRSCRDRGA